MRVSLFKNDYLFSVINKAISGITGFMTETLMNRYLGPFLKGEYTYIMNVVNVVALWAKLVAYSGVSDQMV